MNKMLFIFIFSMIGFVGSSQYNYADFNRYETISNILKSIDIGKYNGVKNTGVTVGVAAIGIFKILKVLKNSNTNYFDHYRSVKEPFIIPFDPSTGLVLNLRK
jgi:hypothetical protein